MDRSLNCYNHLKICVIREMYDISVYVILYLCIYEILSHHYFCEEHRYDGF